MTPADRLTIMLALRKALSILEAEQGENTIPARSKRKNKYLEQIERNYATGTWRKPDELRKRKSK